MRQLRLTQFSNSLGETPPGVTACLTATTSLVYIAPLVYISEPESDNVRAVQKDRLVSYGRFGAQELCESRGGCRGLPVPDTVSEDTKQN